MLSDDHTDYCPLSFMTTSLSLRACPKQLVCVCCTLVVAHWINMWIIYIKYSYIIGCTQVAKGPKSFSSGPNNLVVFWLAPLHTLCSALCAVSLYVCIIIKLFFFFTLWLKLSLKGILVLLEFSIYWNLVAMWRVSSEIWGWLHLYALLDYPSLGTILLWICVTNLSACQVC